MSTGKAAQVPKSGNRRSSDAKRKKRRRNTMTQDSCDTQETMGTQNDQEADPLMAGLPEDLTSIKTRLKNIVDRNGQISNTDLTIQELTEVCLRGRELFMTEPPLVRAPPGICIFGDIHGQYDDLIKMLDKVGVPPQQRLMFLGDYVDRGMYGIEVVTLMTCYKLLYPKQVFLLRGNHETRAVNRQYGFIEECRLRYGERDGNTLGDCAAFAGSAIWTLFLHMFNAMPLAGIVADKVFCCHGGISENLYDMTQFQSIIRPTDICDLGMLCDLVWADPSPNTKTYDASPRAISKIFGNDAVREFLDLHDLDLVVRGHQCAMEGVEWTIEKCVTVFSAPCYCGEMDNKAGVVYIDSKLNVHLYQYTAKKQMDTENSRVN